MFGRAKTHRINIRPEVSILSVLRHLNYKPWFALAEFVDNAIQSFLFNRAALQALHGAGSQLRVEIVLDADPPGRIIVRDNAAGIAEGDYARAFKPAEIPPDRSGLSEFGMGMKSAACWLARQWSARTSALGEPIERTVSFNVSDIVQNRINELDITTRKVSRHDHYMELMLNELHKVPQGRTIGKIREHLASIYRVFLRDNTLVLTFNDEPLLYEAPPILSAPFYRHPEGPARVWRKDIDFDFGNGLRASGFAALREKASVASAGFSLFRRNRVIEGSGDDGYRPSEVFRQSNSYTYQRLFGELHLEGFEVSHTKDGFRWEEHEEIFLEQLATHLDAEPLRLLSQAEGYRVRPPQKSLQVGARAAVESTAEVIEQAVPTIVEEVIDAGPTSEPPPKQLPAVESAESSITKRNIDVELSGRPWRIVIELTTDPAIGDWISLSDRAIVRVGDGERRYTSVRMSLAHPFMDRFAGCDAATIEPLLRIAAALGLAETAARDAGVEMAGTIRRNVNELLRGALSAP